MDRDALIDEFITHQREFFRASVGDCWLEMDLTAAQLKTVFLLSMEQPLTIGVLGQRLGVGLPAASHIADRLVRLGLAERHEDPADRRRAYVRLSGEGELVISRLREGSRERIHERLTPLADADLLELNRLLRILVAPAKTTDSPEPAAASRR